MSDFGWLVTYNICILAFIGVMVWLTGSAWWVLCVFLMASGGGTKGDKSE